MKELFNIGEVLNFLWSVFSQWQALVTGGIITAICFVIERQRDKGLSWRAVRRILVLYFIMATYFAWREERIKFDRLDAATSDAQPFTLDQEQRMIAVLSASTGAVVVSSFSSDRKGKEFAQRIQSTLTRARWAAGSGPGNSNGSGRSLRIFASDPNLKSVSTLITAFNEAGLRYRVFRACQGTDLVLEIGESDLDKAPAIK